MTDNPLLKNRLKILERDKLLTSFKKWEKGRGHQICVSHVRCQEQSHPFMSENREFVVVREDCSIVR